MTPNWKPDPVFAFLITAAGSSQRMGDGQKKEFCFLNDKPVLVSSVEAFLKTSAFSYGLITCMPGTIEKTREIIDAHLDCKTLKKDIILCNGGADRQESVCLGLERLLCDVPEMNTDAYVLIHDGARPWVTPRLIQAVLEGSFQNRACAPVIPAVDAMKTINEKGIIQKHLKRSKTFGIQTPQGFLFRDIFYAHKLARNDGETYIDDTEIFNRYCKEVFTVMGDVENKKITYKNDIPNSKTGVFS